jgi:hypothetical protein
LTDALTTSNRPAEELRGDAHGDVLMSSNSLVGNLFGEEGKDDKQRHYLNIGKYFTIKNGSEEFDQLFS